MVQEMNRICKKLNDALGIAVKLPQPGKNTLRAASVLHLIMGVGLLTVSLLVNSKRLSVIGMIVIASSFVLRHESKISG